MAESMCLNHQERVATARCCVCLKPLCSECAIALDGTNYCSFDCQEKRQEADVRVARLKEEEAAEAARRKQKKFVSRCIQLLVLVAIVFAWPYLPEAVTKPLAQMWAEIVKAFK